MTTMDTPTWIRVAQDMGDHGFWTCAAAIEDSPKFIRADLCEEMVAALEAIIERSNNDPLGTSKVIDMRKIAASALHRFKAVT